MFSLPILPRLTLFLPNICLGLPVIIGLFLIHLFGNIIQLVWVFQGMIMDVLTMQLKILELFTTHYLFRKYFTSTHIAPIPIKPKNALCFYLKLSILLTIFRNSSTVVHIFCIYTNQRNSSGPGFQLRRCTGPIWFFISFNVLSYIKTILLGFILVPRECKMPMSLRHRYCLLDHEAAGLRHMP